MTASTARPNDEKYWAALAALKDMGPSALLRLHDRFNDMSLAWRATSADLVQAGFDRDLAAQAAREMQGIDPDVEMEKVEDAGARIITFASDLFPPLLREIPSQPAILFVRGELEGPDFSRTVGIVGTRRISAYGRQVTQMLAYELAAAGLTVVSGLALGADSVAHRAALEAGGRTIAVLGNGIDTVYPAKHVRLAQDIAQSGAVLTEYPPGTAPAAEHFPQRNRIISGLSMAIIVTEAPARNGAFLTASFANHQGRDVLAVPGDVFSVLSAGCNALIRDGAVMVRNSEDVLEAINLAARAIQLPFEMEPAPALAGDELAVATLLSPKPLHRDEITRNSQLTAQKVASLLTIMEMKGLAKDVGGGHYVQGRVHSVRSK